MCGHEEGAGTLGTHDVPTQFFPSLPPSLTASGRYPVLPQVVLSVWGGSEWKAGVEAALKTRWPLPSSQGDPQGGPSLPSSTALLGFLCFCAAGTRKAQGPLQVSLGQERVRLPRLHGKLPGRGWQPGSRCPADPSSPATTGTGHWPHCWEKGASGEGPSGMGLCSSRSSSTSTW